MGPFMILVFGTPRDAIVVLVMLVLYDLAGVGRKFKRLLE